MYSYVAELWLSDQLQLKNQAMIYELNMPTAMTFERYSRTMQERIEDDILSGKFSFEYVMYVV